MLPNSKKHLVYRFGEYSLDIRRGSLFRKKEELKLRPQSYQVLRVLVQHSGELVKKSDLLDEVWGDRVVTDDSLAQCLIDIRKALGDDNRSIVRTVPRRGYMFDIAVSEVSTDPRSRDKLALRRIAIVSAFVAAAGLVWLFRILGTPANDLGGSIAVLPFVDMSESRDQQYLGNGIADEIISLLSRSPDLRVTARTSTFAFGDNVPDAATIRELLNVAYVLEGSVRKSQDTLRISAQLVDTSDSTNVWSDTYEVSAKNMLGVQKTIADAVLTRLSPSSSTALATQARRNFTANELMLVAREYEEKVRSSPEVDHDTLNDVIRLYREAVAADPASALAHARLGGALLYAGLVRQAEAPIFKALALNPDLSDVQLAQGRFFWLRGMDGAGAAWKRAVELDPNNADALADYAYWLWMQAHMDEALSYYQRAFERDPISLSRISALGEYYAHSAMVDEALSMAKRIEDYFDDAIAYRQIARIHELTGRVDEAIAWTLRARQLDPENTDHNEYLAGLYVDVGDFDTARALDRLDDEENVGLLLKLRRYEDFIDVAESDFIENPADKELRFWLAYALTVTGRPLDAVRILHNAGLPDIVFGEVEDARDLEALNTLMDARRLLGDTEQAMELAKFVVEYGLSMNANYWIPLHSVCPRAVLGQHDEALGFIDSISDSPRLPWAFLIEDMPCLQIYADEPAYQQMLERIELRRREILDKLPSTLKAFGVSL